MNSCTCENCGRINLEMKTLRIQGHVAELCVTCAYVLEQNQECFFKMVCSKSEKQSNAAMKKQHKLLSSLIVVGLVGVFAIIGVGIAENLDAFSDATKTIEQNKEYLSFAILNQLK